MTERQNTLVCAFDFQSLRMTAFDIHEWRHDTVRLQETEVGMVQVDGPRRQVCIKFRDYHRMQETLIWTNGHGEFRHTNGVISQIRIEAAGLRIERVKVTKLPPEVPDRVVRMGLSRYGEVKEVLEENWSRAYRYPVANGIRIAVVSLNIVYLM